MAAEAGTLVIRENNDGWHALLAAQLRYQHPLFWRNSRAAFSAFVLPLVLLFVFDSLQGNRRVGGVNLMQLLTPGIVVFAVMAICYQNLATSLVRARERGLLKRMRGTPLPLGLYLAGRLLYTVAMALLASVLLTLVGVLIFGVRPPIGSLPAAVTTVLLGAAALCAIGFAIATFIPNVDAAPAILSATYIPLALISGIFFPAAQLPDLVRRIVQYLPVEPFAAALQGGFIPGGTAWPSAQQSAVMGAWLVVGVVVAARRFRWEPNV